MSALDNLGPHLLGREVSPPDARDWKLEEFLGTDADLVAQAVAELKQTSVGYTYFAKNPGAYKPTTHWYKGLAFLAQIAPPAPPPSGDVEWQDAEAVLDQGQTGTCVGNGCAQWGNTDPVDDKYVESDARAIYLEATTIYYGAPDNTLQKGCDVRSGVKALKNRGRLSAYAAASSTDAITAYLQAHGPVVVGTDWYNDMFSPDADGLVHPSGGVAGGHCFLAHGYVSNYNGHGPCYKFLNSWSDGWGQAGHFYIKVADFATLLAAQGEAWAALELAV